MSFSTDIQTPQDYGFFSEADILTLTGKLSL